ncbi:MAG TPA: methyltransferase domain-containing protein [Planktothrix sp.]
MSSSEEVKITPENSEWWDNLYRSSVTPWDIGVPAPPFRTFLDSPYAVPPGKLLVPGCGSGYDCMPFLSRGFEVTGLDFSETAIQIAMEKFRDTGHLGTKGFLLHRDLFDIHEYRGYFDYVLEHTCFCAIHPSRRRSYMLAIKDALKPGGRLIALWWLLDQKGGPPYASSKDEIFDLFSENFSIDLAYDPADSVPDRKGRELFTLMTLL